MLKDYFRPEFLNRLDEIIVFESLDELEILQIVDLMLSNTEQLLAGQNMRLKITNAAKKELAKAGFDPTQGARPLRRAIQKEIENKLSAKILSGDFARGDTIKVDYKNNEFVFSK